MVEWDRPVPNEDKGTWGYKVNGALEAFNGAIDSSAETAAAAVTAASEALGVAGQAAADATTALALVAPAQNLRGPRVVTDGDSITYGTAVKHDANNQSHRKDWPSLMEEASDGRLLLVRNAAVAANRSWEVLARFDADVTPYTPDLVFCSMGANDISAGSSDAAREAWIANYEAYRVKCAAIGATLVAGAIFPSDNPLPAGRQDIIKTWNAALRLWAASRAVRVVDWDRFADPVTGGWPAGWSSDGIHPNSGDSGGHMGVFAWESLADLFHARAAAFADSHGAGVISNPLFATVVAYLPPASGSATPSTSAGTLPAGTYSYRFTTRNRIGESVPTNFEATATLSGTGQIALSWAFVVQGSAWETNRGYSVYRKGPSDPTWYFIGNTTAWGTTTLTDNGSAVKGAALALDGWGDAPAGMNMSGFVFPRGSGVFHDGTCRGNFLRLVVPSGGSGYASIPTTALPAAGETWELSGLVRSNGDVSPYASHDGPAIYAHRDVALPGGRWGRFRLRIVAAATVANTPRVGVEIATATSGSADFAELRYVKVG